MKLKDLVSLPLPTVVQMYLFTSLIFKVRSAKATKLLLTYKTVEKDQTQLT